MLKKIIYICITIIVSLISVVKGEETPTELKFTAKVSTVRLNSQLLSQGKSFDDNVSVKVPAILFKPPIRILDVRNAARHKIPEINTLISYHKTLIEGSGDEILAFWKFDERKEKGKLMNDPKTLERVKKYYSENPSLTIHGIIYQKNTVSVLTELVSGSILGQTVTKEGNKIFLTDKPTNDLEIAIIESSIGSGISVSAKREDGVEKIFYENGNLREEKEYRNGQLNGMAKGYYENGSLWWETNYKNDKKDATWKVYYENGNYSETGAHENGKPIGIWKRYHKNGNLSSEMHFENDKFIITKLYDEAGNLILEK